MNNSLLQMDQFNSLDWTPDTTGLYADNKHTGERILMERFHESARKGIVFTSNHGQYTHTE